MTASGARGFYARRGFLRLLGLAAAAGGLPFRQGSVALALDDFEVGRMSRWAG